MSRYLVTPLILLLILAGALFWADDKPPVSVTGLGPDMTISLQAFIVLAAAAVAAIVVLWIILHWLWTLPNRVRGGVNSRRREQAFDAMQSAILEGATGKADTTRRKSEKVRALMRGRPQLGLIVSAEAAHDAGDFADAGNHYRALLDYPETQLYARRGLSSLAVQTQDRGGAIAHAKDALSANPKASWAFDTLLRAQVGDSLWDDALSTLAEGEKRKHVRKNSAARYRAALMTAKAHDLYEADRHDEAADLAASAASASPEFAPATALAAKIFHAQGKDRRARTLIEKAWSVAPHPALGLAYADLIADEKPRTQDKHIDALIKANPSHRESTMVLATRALRAGDAVKAYGILTPRLTAETPTARLCLMAAEAERQMNNPRDSRTWMERAALAPRDPDWSDLDPSGDAFNYTREDWQRLALSYGETGELIHPRQEQRLEARPVIPGTTGPASLGVAAVAGGDSETPAPETASVQSTEDPVEHDTQPEPIEVPEDVEELYETLDPAPLPSEPEEFEDPLIPPSPDNPGVGRSLKSDDLADRLDNLLDPDAKD